jgi:hypothetical protein
MSRRTTFPPSVIDDPAVRLEGRGLALVAARRQENAFRSAGGPGEETIGPVNVAKTTVDESFTGQETYPDATE